MMPVADTDVYARTVPIDRPATEQQPMPLAQPAAAPRQSAESVPTGAPASSQASDRPAAPPRTALVVLAGIGALALAFIVMILVGVSSESINALAVLSTPIASMVAAYYGITLSIQQVRNERAEKEKAIARADGLHRWSPGSGWLWPSSPPPASAPTRSRRRRAPRTASSDRPRTPFSAAPPLRRSA